MVDQPVNKADLVQAIEAELKRQGISGVDAEALAVAIEASSTPVSTGTAEGKRPEDLNSANDD